MNELVLYSGNRNYSSWSLRGYLALALSGLPFRVEMLMLSGPGERLPAFKAQSPSGRVPVLHHGDLRVWDSLAIAEYAAELAPEKHLWPADRGARAVARSVSAEMHSSFLALRTECPMNLHRQQGAVDLSQAARDDIARIREIITSCRADHGAGGPYLFGTPTIADAMYAPVAVRLERYAIDVDDGIRRYMDAIFTLPAMRSWTDEALRETNRIEAYERV
jgi:glutathione S-transferase